MKKSITKSIAFLKHYQWPLLSGIAIGTSYIPFPPWALLFCYVPLWLFVVYNSKSFKEAFLAGWISQFFLTLIGFHWIAHTAHEFGLMPWPLAVIVLILFAATVHIYISLTCGIVFLLKKKWNFNSFLLIMVFPLIHHLIEEAWPNIFPWHLGYPLLKAQMPIYQLASYIGFSGLSLLILFFNAWIAWVISNPSSIRKLISQSFAGIFVFVGLNYLGYLERQKWTAHDQKVTASIIQPNVGNIERVYAEKGAGFRTEIIDEIIQISKKVISQKPNTDIFILPEVAVPYFLDTAFKHHSYTSQLMDGIKNLNRPMIVGAYSRDNSKIYMGEPATYNAIFSMDQSGKTVSAPYRKKHLLVFGEYLPFGESFPFLFKIFPFASNFARGQGTVLLNTTYNHSQIQWGGQICYEGLYPSLSRELAMGGAQLLVNVTNDSWFGTTFEPQQHMYMTFARAIETRLPLIRSTNTGISSVILADGTFLLQSPLHEQWAGEYQILFKSRPQKTFYVLWGHWYWILALMLLVVLIYKGLKNAKFKKS